MSVTKTHILLSSNIPDEMALVLSHASDFTLINNLHMYLRVPLMNQRVTRSTYQHIIEKVQIRLSRWQVKKLSLAGWVTLC